jgi:hypothetical protein
MASRTAKIASSIVAGILAGAPLIAPRNAANAAECLTEPGKDSARGQHWYYRIEHGSKRHCWYLRDQAGNAQESAASDEPAEAPSTARQSSDSSQPRALEDAHAEYPMPPAGTMTAAPAPAPLASNPVANPPQADAQGSAVAARWPSPETASAPAAAAAAAAPPAASSAIADATASAPAADAAPDASSDPQAPPPAAVSSPAPPAPAKSSVSLQMLFAVIGGALALAGLTASVVYRLGRGKKQQRLATRERRAVLWEGVATGPTPPWIEPTVEPFIDQAAPRPTPERRAPQGARTEERYEKFEEILAQLVKQAQQSDA